MSTIKKVEFIKSATKPKEYPPPNKPEIAVVGRSNVGKSSFINAILKRNIAKVSSKPGKTKLINFFSLNDKVYFVDLPGYGFAAVSKAERQRWKDMIEQYFMNRPNLNFVIMLVDSRYEPTKLDVVMREWLESMDIPFVVVATKVDKLTQKEKSRAKKMIRETLDLEKDFPVFLTSAKEGTGIKDVISYIFSEIEKSKNQKENQT